MTVNRYRDDDMSKNKATDDYFCADANRTFRPAYEDATWWCTVCGMPIDFRGHEKAADASAAPLPVKPI